MKKIHAISCFVFALCLILYALPRLPLQSAGMPFAFSTSWMVLAVLALGANLYYALNAPLERKVKRKTIRHVARQRQTPR